MRLKGLRLATATALAFALWVASAPAHAQVTGYEVAKCRDNPAPALPAPESACTNPGYGRIDEAAPTLFASAADGTGARYVLPKDAAAGDFVAAVDPAVYQRVWISKLQAVDIAGVRFAVPTVGATATVTWSAPAPGGAQVTGYRVYLSKDGGAERVAGETAADVLRLTVPGLASGSYLFSVVALAGATESDRATGGARIQAPTKPGQPTNVSISITVAP